MASRKDYPEPSVRTPGPWTARATMSGVTICNPEGVAVAKTPCCDRQAMADGALLAASHDLLSVAKELEESASYWSEYDVPLGIVGRLRAAIAKAEVYPS